MLKSPEGTFCRMLAKSETQAEKCQGQTWQQSDEVFTTPTQGTPSDESSMLYDLISCWVTGHDASPSSCGARCPNLSHGGLAPG